MYIARNSADGHRRTLRFRRQTMKTHVGDDEKWKSQQSERSLRPSVRLRPGNATLRCGIERVTPRPTTATPQRHNKTDIERGARMYLDGRLPEGYVVLCTADADPHSFLVRRLGLSVECPQCGRTALSSDLVVAYYQQRMEPVAG
jgi:hypothetical protein